MTQKEKEIVKELLSLIEKIKNSADDINTDERIPQLELDAMVARIQKLYEVSVALKYFHNYIDEVVIEKQQKLEQLIAQKASETPVAKAIEVLDDEKATQEDEEDVLEEISVDIKSISYESTHEKIKSGVDNSLGNKLKLQPVSDLKAVIGINDKFQFINDLFNGDVDKYNATISNINNSASLEEANQLLVGFNWDKDDEVVQSFLTLVERRFI